MFDAELAPYYNMLNNDKMNFSTIDNDDVYCQRGITAP